MLQIRPSKDGAVELTDRDKSLVIEGGKIRLGETEFSSPGEYEVEGVEIVYGTNAALIVWEKLQTVVAFTADKPSAFEKSQFAPCSILIIDGQATQLDKPKTTELLETYDPSVVVFGSSVNVSDIQDSLKIEDRDVLKLNEAALPTEGREHYRLVG